MMMMMMMMIIHELLIDRRRRHPLMPWCLEIDRRWMLGANGRRTLRRTFRSGHSPWPCSGFGRLACLGMGRLTLHEWPGTVWIHMVASRRLSAQDLAIAMRSRCSLCGKELWKTTGLSRKLLAVSLWFRRAPRGWKEEGCRRISRRSQRYGGTLCQGRNPHWMDGRDEGLQSHGWSLCQNLRRGKARSGSWEGVLSLRRNEGLGVPWRLEKLGF